MRPTPVTPAGTDAILRVHSSAHLAALARLSEAGGGAADADTILGPESWQAALGSAGAGIASVRHAHSGKGHAFAAARPPGHHALPDRAMGFCLVNNVVVAAREAQDLGRDRVLILDWDVHHGNGTQALVELDASIRYVSLHQYPWYPGTGAADERGVGNVFNVPRPARLAPEVYLEDFWAAITTATAEWQPEMILLSAGYDAMAGDPLGGFTLEPGHYATWIERLRERFPDVPLVGMLEGGYAPERVADGVMATITAMS